MKLGMITVYYTENCGSVLQATALKDKIEELGNEVRFISTKNKYSGHSIKRFIKNLLKTIKNKENIFLTIEKFFYYELYIKKNFKKKKKKDILDYIVIGSDTVWDINSQYFLESQDVFWGKIMPEVEKITYAATIANSCYEKLDDLKYPIDSINKFKYISVRDDYTKKYIETRTNKTAIKVCDPTILYDYNYYEKKCKKINEEKYLLLYLFDEPDSKITNEIRNFCEEKSLKIICLLGMGKYISFADKYIESTIDNFLSYYKEASYVITNTFHGTVFSLIFNKNFLVLDYQKNKISNLLNELELTERLVERNIAENFRKEIDYVGVNRKLEELRDLGITYLKESLDEK